MRGIQRVSTKGMSREEWLIRRRKTIGGSDAAGIVGLSRWTSPFSVWADKTGRATEKEDTEAMRQGRDLEDYVARRWMEETGKRVYRLPAMLYHPKYSFAHADVDRMVMGENAGLECKTTFSLDLKQFNGVEFPVQYYAQCIHYLAVTGADRWYLAVLAYGRGFFTFTLERDQAEIDALMAAEADF
jgi:putative phage-type endonuclease